MLLVCMLRLPTRQTSTCQSFLETLIFAYEFYHFQIYNFISVSQSQIEENPDNLSHVESCSLASNHGQLTKLVRTNAFGKILTEKVQYNLL